MFTLGRKIDIHYSTNRIIIIISMVLLIIGWVIYKDIMSGVYIGGGAFLTWALAREIDPKHEYSAFLCVFLSLINILFYKSIQVLVIFWVILIVRMINGITGKALTFFDIFSLLGMTVYLSISTQNSIYLLPFIVAIGFIVKLQGKRGPPFIAGIIAVIIFLAESLYMQYFSFNSRAYSDMVNIFIVAVVLIFFIAWIFLSKDEIRDDFGKIINNSRITSSQITYGLVVVLLYFSGNTSMNNLIIYTSVIAGVIIYGTGYKIFILVKNHLNK